MTGGVTNAGLQTAALSGDLQRVSPSRRPTLGDRPVVTKTGWGYDSRSWQEARSE
jgi:hypothetical protein